MVDNLAETTVTNATEAEPEQSFMIRDRYTSPITPFIRRFMVYGKGIDIAALEEKTA